LKNNYKEVKLLYKSNKELLKCRGIVSNPGADPASNIKSRNKACNILKFTPTMSEAYRTTLN
jgi:hypothetical protein